MHEKNRCFFVVFSYFVAISKYNIHGISMKNLTSLDTKYDVMTSRIMIFATRLDDDN